MMSIYVGIGASAGGLKALEELVGDLPVDSGFRQCGIQPGRSVAIAEI